MMEVRANLRYLRISPRKVRLVAETMRGKSAEEAELILNFTAKNAARPVLKLLKSAIANAKHNFNLNKEQLLVKSVRIDKGPTLKRFMPRARGSASRINKRSSHVSLVLTTNYKL